MGILAGDEVDLRWVIEHWKITKMVIECEPHEDVVIVRQCEERIMWLESTLRVAEEDRAAQQSLA